MMKDEHKNKYVHRYFVHFFSNDIQVATNATVFWLAIEMTKTTKSTKLSNALCVFC